MIQITEILKSQKDQFFFYLSIKNDKYVETTIQDYHRGSQIETLK